MGTLGLMKSGKFSGCLIASLRSVSHVNDVMLSSMFAYQQVLKYFDAQELV